MRRGPGKWKLILAFALTAVGGAPSARAEDERGFAFEWLAPEGCPPASAVEQEIAHLLGGPAREHAKDDLRLQATVEHGLLWSVTLETTSRAASGHRTIEAATCQGLANATALIVALLVDPDAVAARTGKARDDEPQAAPPPVPSAPRPMGDRPGRTRATHGLVAVAADGNLGLLPSPDLGVSASVGMVRPRWRLEARGVYHPRRVQSDALADPSGAHGRFSFMAGTLAGCLTFSRPMLEFGPCLDGEFGVVRGEGIGASSTTSHTSPWLGAGAGAFLAIKATRWLYLPVHADAVVPLWRPRYVFQHVQAPIFRSAIVGGRLTAGVELRF